MKPFINRWVQVQIKLIVAEGMQNKKMWVEAKSITQDTYIIFVWAIMVLIAVKSFIIGLHMRNFCLFSFVYTI